jgi:hypothetical protein
MNDRFFKILNALEQSAPVALDERLLEAAMFIDKFRGAEGWRCVSPVVDEAEVAEEEIAKLKAALIKFITTQPENPLVSTAIWALGRFGDASLRGFFLDQLRCHHEARRVHPMGQAGCVLEGIDDVSIYEFVPGETVESEGYREAVAEYLRRNLVANDSVPSKGR